MSRHICCVAIAHVCETCCLFSLQFGSGSPRNVLTLCSTSGHPRAQGWDHGLGRHCRRGVQGIASEALIWSGGRDGTGASQVWRGPHSDLSNCFYSLEKLRSELSKFPCSYNFQTTLPPVILFPGVAHSSCPFFCRVKKSCRRLR